MRICSETPSVVSYGAGPRQQHNQCKFTHGANCFVVNMLIYYTSLLPADDCTPMERYTLFSLFVDGGICSAGNNGVFWWQLWRYVFFFLRMAFILESIEKVKVDAFLHVLA